MYYNRISIFPDKFLKTVTMLDFQWRWEIYKAAVLWKSNFLLPVLHVRVTLKWCFY